MTVHKEKIFTTKKYLVSADDYQRMGAIGIFEGKERVELIDGVIYTMPPFSPLHSSHVDKASQFFIIKLYRKFNIRTQSSIRTDVYSEPEPDLSILKFKEDFYSKRPATAEDTLLIIEVAVTSVEIDRSFKKEKYAKSGIPEYWIIIPEKQIIEVYKQPEDGDYAEKTTYRANDIWTIEAFGLEVKGSDFLIP